MEQGKNNKRFNPWLILTIVFILGACICIGFLLKTVIDQKNKAEEMSNLVKKTSEGDEILSVVPIESSSETDSSSFEATSSETVEVVTTPEPEDPFEKSIRLMEEAGIPVPDLEVDIPNLQETVNADIYAWIYIPGTKVNYPVLQHPTDDSYYLNYNLDGSKGYPGCIYSEKKYNSQDFWDANTVLYGHNMKNGTMFGSIHKYEDETFFYENRYIYVYTQERIFAYKIFAAYVHSNEHLLYNNTFDEPDKFMYYFEKVLQERNMNRIFDDEIELTGEEHIITLSTCINGKPENRFLVQGVLMNEE
ncbi:MAG: class B sortase [Lachnospiraceae bacterium]|nr:class B sortase [Lachnospiraceae bacterium]